MRTWWFLLILLAPLTMAEIYKTIDKDGRTVYTDKPKTESAEKVELRGLNTVPGAQPLPNSSPTTSFDSRPARIEYTIDIISPRSDVIIPVGQRDLAIAAVISPALQSDHLLVYFMNGELLEETTMSNIIVKDVPRGTHTLVIEVIDQSGQSLGISPPVIVNVMRHVVKKNAPPMPKPRPSL